MLLTWKKMCYHIFYFWITIKTFMNNFWNVQVNFGMVTLLTLKNISVHWDYFPQIKTFIDKFPVYTNYLSSIWLVKTDLVYTKIFQWPFHCNHSIVNLDTSKLTWIVLTDEVYINQKIVFFYLWHFIGTTFKQCFGRFSLHLQSKPYNKIGQ